MGRNTTLVVKKLDEKEQKGTWPDKKGQNGRDRRRKVKMARTKTGVDCVGGNPTGTDEHELGGNELDGKNRDRSQWDMTTGA